MRNWEVTCAGAGSSRSLVSRPINNGRTNNFRSILKAHPQKLPSFNKNINTYVYIEQKGSVKNSFPRFVINENAIKFFFHTRKKITNCTGLSIIFKFINYWWFAKLVIWKFGIKCSFIFSKKKPTREFFFLIFLVPWQHIEIMKKMLLQFLQ